jgi:hypothetical protein
MTRHERHFLGLVKKYTHSLPEYDRGVTDVFALAAFRAGYRTAEADRSRCESRSIA